MKASPVKMRLECFYSAVMENVDYLRNFLLKTSENLKRFQRDEIVLYFSQKNYRGVLNIQFSP